MYMAKYDRAYLIDIVAIVTSFVIARKEKERDIRQKVR